MKQPNCAICAWIKTQPAGGMIAFAGKQDMTFCSAQGDSTCLSVYGKRVCRRLYKEKTDALNELVMGAKA